MSQRNALIVAAALTAFVLVVVGGLAARISQTPEQAGAPAELAAPAALPALDPAVEALVREREAAYQAALAEAAARLEAANAELARANAQPAPAGPAYAVTPEQAGAIALAAAPGAALAATPELVSYEGGPAYEVRLDRGLVYVDAQSGAVRHNGAAAPLVAQAGEERALQAALAYSGGGRVVKVELEDERGMQVYEVTLSDGGKIYVEAASGQVVYARMAGAAHGGEEHDD